MPYIKDRISFQLGRVLGRRIAGQRVPASSTEIAISALAATFDPLTAEAVIGESGTLEGGEYAIGYGGQPIRYSNGHLIIEDQTASDGSGESSDTTTEDNATEDDTAEGGDTTEGSDTDSGTTEGGDDWGLGEF